MSDPQRPKSAPPAPNFEVPDLELEALPRGFQKPKPAPQRSPPIEVRGTGSPAQFDDDAFQAGSLSLDSNAAPRNVSDLFGSTLNFEDPDGFELEPVAAHESLGRQVTSEARPESAAATGRALDVTRLVFDPLEIAILADYGPAPTALQLAPAYAYRVFTRKRELRRELLTATNDCERAELARDTTLAELARAVRPAAEQVEALRSLWAPVVELEQLASTRSQALATVNQQLSAQDAELDAALTRLEADLAEQEREEREAAQHYDEREAMSKRAEAKSKRVQIEIRAVTQVAEQKLGPAGGEVPEPEASQLSALRQRARDAEPEVQQAEAELAQARQARTQARSKLEALRQSKRAYARRKQALAEQYRKELELRSLGLSQSESQQRAALADVARAVLGSDAGLELPEPLLERVRREGERASQLLVRREMLRRALESYDPIRVKQGVQLLCSVLAVCLLFCLFKLIF